MHIRPVGLTLAALALVLAVACGGDDGKGSLLSGGANTWDVTKASDLAHAALLVAGDLPGSGWAVTDDDFGSDDEPMASGCSDFEGFKKDAKTNNVARAKRELEKPGASRDDFGTQVESTVSIYKDTKTAGDLLNRYKGIVGSDKFISCFESQLKQQTSKDAKVTLKKISPAGSAPSGGVSTAIDVDLSVGRDSLVARTENYVWVMGNAAIQLSVTATKDSFNADVIKAAIAKQEQAANEALKGTRQPTRGASATPTAVPVRTTPTPAPTTRPSGSPTPQRSSTSNNLNKVGLLEDTSSHRYVIKVDSSGIDFFEMQDLVNSIQSLVGGSASRAGAPIALEVTGAYSKPDKAQVKFVINTTSLSLTTIGTQQWTQFGTTTQGPKSVGRQSVEDLSLAVSMLSGLSGDEDLLKLLKCSGNETVNGVAARKCGFAQGELSRADLQQFVDGFLDEVNVNVKINAADVTKASFHIWAAQQGDYPVRLLFEFAGKDSTRKDFSLRLESNVTDINRTIDIVAPR